MAELSKKDLMITLGEFTEETLLPAISSIVDGKLEEKLGPLEKKVDIIQGKLDNILYKEVNQLESRVTRLEQHTGLKTA
ncbi:MAG: hypothetical protein A3I07_02430 [Candidatus Doudnabacteria bacterium RIFCSPLOWO2_02_FULL_42_9]|uniref:Uncharacterized protein n=1 Tax=Candidatus Doudnabacteria bacterium RIFCSPHIGHO2_01_FULL_41_86 TaxID=1817821 RepID=A0A1F5N7S0_9BACT|nr:MAG: hypothetical protein A2717_03140 [Candidatus Doudnabacteria bacterium RIFCSPHIGHO2_01_FULL_41_86]OGE74690.1 MAG: hypothetical protein A3K07_02735 [Candidatus Doudnabacteria bacterium RIFCSPHIGHO2_01_43_10]OGE85049.1 MAG: hypothetical protein A3E28_04545 [Candidatus Doudnabacteria bacterium RIFCSPHIGHO2_12_FULL_42_22]OGE86490.1 MAG: hypothetical protein A3C49_04725 [Candidatus Doudnabacteria bacterium RIFCSPHIGHO2_02_FULL_42_25]OGE91952.1 MAG: hypothetical protein A2895_01490 [Candidatus